MKHRLGGAMTAANRAFDRSGQARVNPITGEDEAFDLCSDVWSRRLPWGERERGVRLPHD